MSLDRLLGTWDTTMHHVAIPEPVTGRQSFERVLDGAYVLQRTTYDSADVPDAMAVLDDERLHYFDVRGVTRVFELLIDEGGWSIIRRDEDFWQRSALAFDGDDAMEGTGEMSHDRGTTWEHDFRISYARIR